MATRKWGSERLVDASLTGNEGNSSVAVHIDGGFVVVWRDDSGTDSAIRGQRYDALGNKVGAEIFINSFTGDLDNQSKPTVTGLADGGFYVAWEDTDSPTDHDITGAVFDADGSGGQAAIVIATLQAGATMVLSDILIVCRDTRRPMRTSGFWLC